MFVRQRVQGFESSVNEKFQWEKLVNSKTILYSPLRSVVQQEVTNLFQICITEIRQRSKICPIVTKKVYFKRQGKLL